MSGTTKVTLAGSYVAFDNGSSVSFWGGDRHLAEINRQPGKTVYVIFNEEWSASVYFSTTGTNSVYFLHEPIEPLFTPMDLRSSLDEIEYPFFR